MADFIGIIVDDPSLMVKLCCNVGVAGKTRNHVFARLSCTTFGTLIQKVKIRMCSIMGTGKTCYGIYESNFGK